MGARRRKSSASSALSRAESTGIAKSDVRRELRKQVSFRSKSSTGVLAPQAGDIQIKTGPGQKSSRKSSKKGSRTQSIQSARESQPESTASSAQRQAKKQGVHTGLQKQRSKSSVASSEVRSSGEK